MLRSAFHTWLLSAFTSAGLSCLVTISGEQDPRIIFQGRRPSGRFVPLLLLLTRLRVHVIIKHSYNLIGDGCELTNSFFSSVNGLEGEGPMFEQLDDPKLAGRKSWKERLSEGAVILVVVVVVIGVLVYVLISK